MPIANAFDQWDFIFLKPENSESFQKRVVSKNCNDMLSHDIYFFLLNWIHKKGCIGQKRKKKHRLMMTDHHRNNNNQ